MIDISSSQWMDQLIEASAQAEASSVLGDETVTVSLAIGKKACVFTLNEGQVKEAASDVEPDVTIPVTNKQLVGLVDGSIQLSRAYMEGNIKPVGSSRALLHVIELFDNEAVRANLAQQFVD